MRADTLLASAVRIAHVVDVGAAADCCIDRSMLVGLQRRLIYFPFPAQVPRAETVVAGAREVTLRTVDGLALGAWLVEAGEPERGVAVLVANGNAGNRSLRAPLARAASAGLAVLLFDYRGFGGNPGGDRASRGSPAMCARPTGS
jgi:hypothetical protein